MNKFSTTLFILFAFIFHSNAQRKADCDILWNEAVFGECIGDNNNLISFDHQNDGTIELIANTRLITSVFESYWYILKYDSVANDYKKIYSSPLYEEYIETMSVVDINYDGEKELLFSADISLYVVDLITYETRSIQGYSNIRNIKFGDGDNDGDDEIIFGTFNKLYFADPISLEIDTFFQITDAENFEIGNVDSDLENEIVFPHGLVVEINNDQIENEYDFDPDLEELEGYCTIILEDIDNDDIKEAIIEHGWVGITVYDVETENLKYEIYEVTTKFESITVTDYNDDDVFEIIYGIRISALTNDDIVCVNAEDGSFLWSIDEPGSIRPPAIVVDDFDQDNQKEIVWSEKCFSSAISSLKIHDALTQDFEWESVSIKGPFHAVEVGDIDQDGTEEIIAITEESNQNSSVLSVYNALTKELEFQSDADFLDNVAHRITNIEIYDYLNDGDMDIILAISDIHAGRLVVIDGNQYFIEQDYAYNPFDVSEFYGLEISDIDGDGVDEFITYDDSYMYFINSISFQIEESINYNPPWLSFPSPTELVTGNIDNDSALEVVHCFTKIYTVDGVDLSLQETVESDYTSVQLYDWNNDGIMEIIAGKSTGFLEIIDGSTLSLLESYPMPTGDFGVILFEDIYGDQEDEIITTIGNRLYFIFQDGQYVASQPISSHLGHFDALEVTDFDNDGVPNIVLGTSYGVMEIDPHCVECIDFDVSFFVEDPACGDDDGTIQVTSNDTSTIFTSNGIIFEDSLYDLEEGNYNVIAQNELGCIWENSIELVQQQFYFLTDGNNVSCFGGNDGQAFTIILQGTPPYIYSWSNGSTQDTLNNLMAGSYTVTITDNNGCQRSRLHSVGEPDQISLEADIQNDNVETPELEGRIEVLVLGGISPYSYMWDNGNNTNILDEIGEGEYSLTITDANNCLFDTTFVLPVIVNVSELQSSLINIYPNPAKDIIYLDAKENNVLIKSISLISPTGQKQNATINFTNDHFEINLTEIANGLTILIIDYNGIRYYKKIIKVN